VFGTIHVLRESRERKKAAHKPAPGAFLREQAADLIGPLVVAVGETVEPVADFGLQLETIKFPH